MKGWNLPTFYYTGKTVRCMYVHIGFKRFFYVVRHLDSIASYLPTGLHLGFFRSWPSLFLPSSFSSVVLVLSFVSASTSMIFWTVFLLPFFEHGHTKAVRFFEIFSYECRWLIFWKCFLSADYFSSPSQWPRRLRRGSKAARLLGLRVWNPPRA